MDTYFKVIGGLCMTSEQKVKFFQECADTKCANCVGHYVDRNRLLALNTALYAWKEENEKDLKNIEESLQPTCNICKRYQNLFK